MVYQFIVYICSVKMSHKKLTHHKVTFFQRKLAHKNNFF